MKQFSSVQSLSHVRLFATPWIAARQASLSITNSWSSLKLMCIESVMPSSHLILYHPLRLLPPIPPSIRVFSNESTLLIRWPKYWSFSFSIIPSKEIPGLISFRMDWLDLFAVHGMHTFQNPAKNIVHIIHFSWFPIPKSKWILQPLNATLKSCYSITLICCNLSLLLTLICFLNVSALSYMASTRQRMQHTVAVLKSFGRVRLFATHELQHARLPCPSLCPRVCSNSCPLSQWCHPSISSSVDPFSCPQSFPASGSFPMSQFFSSGGQSIGASVSTSVLPMHIQGWFPLGLTGLITLLSKGISKVFSSTTVLNT